MSAPRHFIGLDQQKLEESIAKIRLAADAILPRVQAVAAALGGQILSHIDPPCTTDMRIGVTSSTHAVLDRADQLSRDFDHPEWFLAESRKALAAALRASPDNGTGTRRIERAREAAALLILALNRMDDQGRELVR